MLVSGINIWTVETEETLPLSLITSDYLCLFQGLMFGYLTDETEDTMPLSLITFDYLCLFQGLMFGYATDETEEAMPLTILLAHKLNAKMALLRNEGVCKWMRPDSKTQVRNMSRRVSSESNKRVCSS